jgi:hypothetical protein
MGIISITLHDGDTPPQHIHVDETNSIQVLEDYIPVGGRRLICHHGSILLTGFSFMYHGVKENDHLYVIRPICPPERLSEVTTRPSFSARQLSADCELFPDFVGSSSLIREAARLSDLDDRILAFSRFTRSRSSFNQSTAVNSNRFKQPMVICSVPSSDCPNSEALPLYDRWRR